MTDKKILDRLEKLMRLAESTTHDGEREAAWERINHLLTEYRIELSDIQRDKSEVINHQFDLTAYSPGRRWRLALLLAVKEYLPIQVLFTSRYAWVYCRPDELELALFLYDSIRNQLERDARAACRAQEVESGRAQKWRARFMFAAVEVISSRFALMRKEQAQSLLQQSGKGQQALVLLDADRAAVEAYVDEAVKPKKAAAFRESWASIWDADDLGREAGQKANLNPGLKS